MCQRRKHGDVVESQAFGFFFSQLKLEPNSCMPTTEKIKITMARTTVRFPRAPTEWPMILISVFKVGQDLANLKTLSCRYRQWTKMKEKPVKDKFYLFSHKTNDMVSSHSIYDFQKPFQSQSILNIATNSISQSDTHLYLLLVLKMKIFCSSYFQMIKTLWAWWWNWAYMLII